MPSTDPHGYGAFSATSPSTQSSVRRYEQENFAELDAEELTEKFRMAWSL